MMEAKNTSIGHWRKRLLIIPPLLLGALAIYYSSMLKDKPEQLIVDERASKVRVIMVTKQDVIPRAIGYGSVRPSRTWDAVAEVAGQVVWVSDQLKKGHRIQAGTEILRIDDANYQLILAQIEAELKVADVKDRTTRASLTIAEKDLKIASEDLNRKQDLRKKGTIAQAEVDAAERLMLGSESQVQNLHNTLALTAAEKRVLASKKSIAELDLDRTRLSTPFEVRITDVKIGAAQYANKGQLLFSADSLDVAEIEALFPIGVLRPLINASQTDPSNERPGVMGLQATVRLHTATHKVEWPARIDRVSSVIDPQTQSLGVVVAIDRPAEQAQPGQRPPLYRNTFVEVALFSAPLVGQLLVPLTALHNGQVYLVNADNRLEIRNVELAFTLGSTAVIKQGLQPGERVVTSDMTTAIAGMLLDPQDDKKTQQRMLLEATGQELAE